MVVPEDSSTGSVNSWRTSETLAFKRWPERSSTASSSKSSLAASRPVRALMARNDKLAGGSLRSPAKISGASGASAASARRALESAGHDVSVIAVAESGETVRLDSGAELTRYERDELSRVLESGT